MSLFKNRNKKRIYDLIDGLTLEDFSFSVKTTTIYFEPKKLISSSIKIKTDDDEICEIAPIINANVNCIFLQIKDRKKVFRVYKDRFELFKSKYEVYDKVESEVTYLSATFSNKDKKTELTQRIISFSRLYNSEINFEIELSTSEMLNENYGIMYWKIPYLITNTEETDDKEKLLNTIKIHFKNLI